MRATILAAGGLAGAGAAMTIAAFAGGASDPPKPAAPRAHAAAGLDVWVAQGCGSCHTFKPAGSTAPIGPDLQQTLRGADRDYVMRAIVLPGADAAPGYDPGMMPDDYARRIDPADLERLADFVLAGVRGQ
ncbi:MAG TPA: c-type cytochrome [Solirubrobacter sp.]|nr:c-type cytochrome [Solirubrobacter sp.]